MQAEVALKKKIHIINGQMLIKCQNQTKAARESTQKVDERNTLNYTCDKKLQFKWKLPITNEIYKKIDNGVKGRELNKKKKGKEVDNLGHSLKKQLSELFDPFSHLLNI